jgi:hypothetical protein
MQCRFFRIVTGILLFMVRAKRANGVMYQAFTMQYKGAD